MINLIFSSLNFVNYQVTIVDKNDIIGNMVKSYKVEIKKDF